MTDRNDNHPGMGAADAESARRAKAAEEAMEPRDNAFAGAAEGGGSIGFDEDGATDVGSDDPDENERKAPGQ